MAPPPESLLRNAIRRSVKRAFAIGFTFRSIMPILYCGEGLITIGSRGDLDFPNPQPRFFAYAKRTDPLGIAGMSNVPSLREVHDSGISGSGSLRIELGV